MTVVKLLSGPLGAATVAQEIDRGVVIAGIGARVL